MILTFLLREMMVSRDALIINPQKLTAWHTCVSKELINTFGYTKSLARFRIELSDLENSGIPGAAGLYYDSVKKLQQLNQCTNHTKVIENLDPMYFYRG